MRTMATNAIDDNNPERSVRKTWGFACPKCGGDERLHVIFESLEILHPDGSETVGTPRWRESSPCRCDECNYAATARDFRLPEVTAAR